MAAQIRAGLKKSFLNAVWNGASAGASLEDALLAFQQAIFTGVSGGQVIESTSQAGHSTKFVVPTAIQHFQQPDVMEMAQEFLDIYANAEITLSSAGTASPSDEAILATMMADDAFQGITQVQYDFSTLRWPTRQ